MPTSKDHVHCYVVVCEGRGGRRLEGFVNKLTGDDGRLGRTWQEQWRRWVDAGCISEAKPPCTLQGRCENDVSYVFPHHLPEEGSEENRTLISDVMQISAFPEQSTYFTSRQRLFPFSTLVPESSGPTLWPISKKHVDICYLFHALISLLASPDFPYFLLDFWLLLFLKHLILLYWISQLKSFFKHSRK